MTDSIYRVLAMQNFNIPAPSKLFSLQPEGMGSPYCESLASYAMRLAEAHCIDVCVLIYQFVHPLISSAWKDTPSRRSLCKVDRADLGAPRLIAIWRPSRG